MQPIQSKEDNMSDSKIRAIIKETSNGAYYNVLLQGIPTKGDYISLYSHLDQSTGHKATHNYEIVSVLHIIHDVTEKVEKSKHGYHEITLTVKPASGSVFN